MTTAQCLLDDLPTYFSIGFSMSVILSFTAWSIMKVWRFVVDIIKISTSLTR